MIRVLAIIAVVFLAAAGFAWLAERPGAILLTWQGYEIRTSLMVAAIILALFIGAIALIGAIIRAILSTPQSVGHFLGARRRDRGYRALTRGMVAVGAGDVRVARRAAQESRALLGNEPLVLLLSAQAAQIAGDGAGARTAFETLSADHDTRMLGLHGLFIEARRQGEDTAARHFAEEAVKMSPQIGWAGQALFDYQTRAGDWQAALATLDVNTGSGLIDKARSRRLRAVLDTARAMELEGGDPDEARALAFEAHRLAPDLIPAAVIAARLLTRNGEIRRAGRILEQTWKLSPHPDIATAYTAVRSGDSVRDRLKRVRRLSDMRANHPEGAFAVAQAAIEAHDWPVARDALGGAMRANPTERVCLLMAEIEEGENGDQGRVRSWLTRALTAPRDPAWVADGRVFERWMPISPVSGAIDVFEWKAPADRPPRIAAEVEMAAALAPVEVTAVAVPRAAVASAPVSASAVSPPTSPFPVAAEPAMVPSLLRSGGVRAAEPAGRPRPMARAPDDPGPESAHEDGVDPVHPLFHPGRIA